MPGRCGRRVDCPGRIPARSRLRPALLLFLEHLWFADSFAHSRQSSPVALRFHARRPRKAARRRSPARCATPPAARFPAPASASSTRRRAARSKWSATSRARTGQSLPPGTYRIETTLDGFETAGPAARARARGQTAAVELTLTPARLTEGVVVTRQARRGGGAGGADSAVGHQSEPRRERRRLQRQPPEGADSDGAVLFDQPAQLVDQHPRAGRAVRPDQRRPRARRRALHRRRLLRPAGGGHARLPRHRAHRGAARTAGDAVRQEHHRRSDQRHDAEAQLHARRRLRAQCRRLRASSRPRRRRPARSASRSPAGCRSRARSATARSTTCGRRTT